MKLPLSSDTSNNVMHNGGYDNEESIPNGFPGNRVVHNTNTFNGTSSIPNSVNPSPDSPSSTTMSSVPNSATASNGTISLASNGRPPGFYSGASTNGTADNSPSTPSEPQPFYTPQLNIKSPLQGCLNMQMSQDSLDIYHDATGSLHRVRHNSGGMSHMMARPHSRRRHASASMTNTNTPDLSATAGILASAKLSARVRTYSYNSTVPDTDKNKDETCEAKINGTPVHIGRLSLSTHSLKLRAGRDNQSGVSSPKLKQRPMQPLNSPAENMPMLCGNEVQMSPKLNKPNVQTNTVAVQTSRSVSPHLDFDNLQEHQDNDALPNERLIGPTQSNFYAKHNISPRNNTSSAWRNNYVRSVETDQMIQNSWISGHTIYNHDTTQQGHHRQVYQQNSAGKHSAEEAMYTFGPVQRRRLGLARVKDEFRRENLRLEHKAPHLFVTSQWQQHNRMSCVYLGYRLFWALYLLMWTFWAFAGSFGYQAPLSMKAYHFMYMTNWGLWMLTIDANIQAFNTIWHFRKMANDGDASYPCMPFRHKVSWAFSNITGTAHLFITLAYWITVYPNRSGELSAETRVMLEDSGVTIQDEKFDEIGFHTHLLPALYVLLDVCVSATPRRLLHVYWPMAFFCSYITFNLTYYLCGGLDYRSRPAIYPSMDWTKPQMTIPLVIVMVFVVTPFLHGIICALYAARVKIWRILKISRYVREEDEVEQVDQTRAQEQNV